jgi:hypothetical protein
MGLVNRPVGLGIGHPAKASLSPMPYYQQIPTWNNAGRPKKPKVGVIGFNLETNSLDYWTGTTWMKLPMEKINV